MCVCIELHKLCTWQGHSNPVFYKVTQTTDSRHWLVQQPREFYRRYPISRILHCMHSKSEFLYNIILANFYKLVYITILF